MANILLNIGILWFCYYRNDEELEKEIVKAIQAKLSSLSEIEVLPHEGFYEWNFHYKLPAKGQGIVFFVAKSSNDVHVAISPKARTMDPMYEIVIGGWSNTISAIRKKSQGQRMCFVNSGLLYPIDGEGLNYFWISIDSMTQLIQIGRGKQPNLNSIFCIYKDLDFINNVEYVTFTSFDTPVTYSSISIALIDHLTQYSWIHNLMEQVIAPKSESLYLSRKIPPTNGSFVWSTYHEFLSKGQGIVKFTIESSNEVHVAISPQPQTMDPMYKIVIGGSKNSICGIRRRLEGENLSFVHVGLNEGINHLWVSIDVETELIMVGQGREFTLNSVICVYKDFNFISNAQYVCFATNTAPVIISNISMVSMNPFSRIQSSQDFEEYHDNCNEDGIKSHSFDLPTTIPIKCGYFDWSKYYELLEGGQGIVKFTTESSSEVHIAISPQPQTMDPMYKIVIGGWSNSMSVIRKKWEGERLSLVHVGLMEGINHFWVSIDVETKLIQVGRGKEPNLESIFCIYKDIDFITKARYVSFTTYEAPVTISDIQLDSIGSLLRNQSNLVLGEPLLPSPNTIKIPQFMHGEFQWLTYYEFPSQGQGIISFTTTRNDVHVAISPRPQTQKSMYQFIIGGRNNAISNQFIIGGRNNAISKLAIHDRNLPNGVVCIVNSEVLYPSNLEVYHLWLSIDLETQIIQVGRGKKPMLESSVILVYKDANFIRNARYISFSSSDQAVEISNILVFPTKCQATNIKRSLAKGTLSNLSIEDGWAKGKNISLGNLFILLTGVLIGMLIGVFVSK